MGIKKIVIPNKLSDSFEIITESDYAGTPDGNGVLEHYALEIPVFEKGSYYSVRDPKRWPDGLNQVEPRSIESFRDIPRGGLFLLLRLNKKRYLAILPIAGKKTVSWLDSSEDTLVLSMGTLGTAPLKGDFPLCSWAEADDPFIASRKSFETAIENELVSSSTRLRHEKHYPEIFRYLGWCSWEEYKKHISESLLIEAMDKLEQSGVPIRYMLVDDGHLDSTKDRRLISFNPNEKFPDVWKRLLDRRREDKVKWIGLWLCFNGYWNGISENHNLENLRKYLMSVSDGVVQPKRDFLSSTAFYDTMIGEARSHGFDFVKVDVQARNITFYQGTENAVECAANNSQALEAACARHMDGLINCMAHNSVCVFNTRLSAVTRCSRDYFIGDIEKAKAHLSQSYANMVWMGQTVWGDHDMFHSNDPVAGRMMAVSKALSGGPVYLSDAPDQFSPEHIRPLCFNDGELLRPLAPAAPVPESLFVDPHHETLPYKVVAPLANESAVVAVYNLTDPEVSVSGTVTVDDYANASCMMQPYPGKWIIPEEGLMIYDWYAGKAERLSEKYFFELKGFGDRLFHLCPIRSGWAVIGLADKFLSPAGIEIRFCTETTILVQMLESGPLSVWNMGAKGLKYVILKSDKHSGEFKPIENGLWNAAIEAGQKNVLIKITRTE